MCQSVKVQFMCEYCLPNAGSAFLTALALTRHKRLFWHCYYPVLRRRVIGTLVVILLTSVGP